MIEHIDDVSVRRDGRAVRFADVVCAVLEEPNRTGV